MVGGHNCWRIYAAVYLAVSAILRNIQVVVEHPQVKPTIIRTLDHSIFHFHTKDTKIDPVNATVNGVLDAKSYRDFARRSWIFRTGDYGHNEDVWQDRVSNLQLVGYKGVLFIEDRLGGESNEEIGFNL